MKRIALLIFALSVLASCDHSKFPIDEKPVVKVDPSLYGIWRVKTDTDKRNFILVQDGTEDGLERPDKEHVYFITYFNRGGVNRGYENFDGFLSDVGGQRFLNVSYWAFTDEGKMEREEGYLLYKILNENAAGDRVSLLMVHDSTLAEAGSAKDVRTRVEQNLNNRKFYGDTSELSCVAHGHFTKKEAVKRARGN